MHKIDDVISILVKDSVIDLKCDMITERKSCNITEKSYYFSSNIKDDLRVSATFTQVIDENKNGDD